MTSRMENHCICLLAYASRHPEGRVSFDEAVEECGIPEGTLKAIYHFHRHHGIANLFRGRHSRVCYLCVTAWTHGYSFRLRTIDEVTYIEAVKDRSMYCKS